MGTHDNISGSSPDDQNQNGSSGQGSSNANTGSGQQGQPGTPASGSNTGQAGQNSAGSSNSGSGSNSGQSSSSSSTNSSQSNTNAAGSQGSAATPPSALGEATAGASQNLHDTKEALDKAKNTISNLMDGKANIVDAAVAVKGAFDAVKGLSGKISESLMMPVMKALGAFKGQAILPAAKQMDPVMGIDVHMVNIPPSPAPIPMPHPYIGMLFNAKDFVSCAINTFKKDLLDTLPAPAPDDKSTMASVASNKDAIAGMAMAAMNMTASVKFGDFIPRAVVGTPTKSIPHIPMGAGFFPAFDAAVQKNVGKAFLGSLFVVADGDPMVGSFHLNYDCWDIGVIDLFKSQRKGAIKSPPPVETKAELFVPSGTVMPIPLGRPVLVNSIPTPINPLSIVDKLFKAGLGKLAGMARKMAQKGLDKLNGKVGCGPLTAASKLIGTGQSHPVDVASGHFYTDNIDFKLPGPIPLEFERTWHSYSIYEGPLGYGWHHSYDLALAIDFAEEAAIMRLGDGRVAHFELPTKEKEAYNRGEKLTLCLHEDGYYYATDKKGLIYRFSDKTHYNPFNKTETHLLQSIANRNGFAIRFSYDKNCTLTEIIDSAGRKLIINNDGKGHITDIQAPDPRFQGRSTFAITKYTYTPEGDMASQADAMDQAMSFVYEQHQMVREVWRNGCVWQFRYDKTSGPDAKCVEVFGTGGLLHYKFDYTDPTCTIATNSRGFKKLFYHKNGVVTKFVDPLGAAWEYRYNQYNELEAELDPLGNHSCYTYDEFGNLATKIAAEGSFLQIEYKVPALRHFPSSAIDIRGGKWQWNYDVTGNLIERCNPLGLKTSFIYQDGLVQEIREENGSHYQLKYDRHYNRIEYCNVIKGTITNYDYDLLGNKTLIINPHGQNIKYNFDLKGRVTEIKELDNNIIYLSYDPLDNIIVYKDKNKEINYSYTNLHKLANRTESGENISFTYDTEDQLIKITNENKETYRFEYDASGNMIQESTFDDIVRTYERNQAGWVTRVNRPGNRFSEYKHDPLGRIVEARYYDDTFNRYSYQKGDLVFASNQDSVVIFEHDIMGNIISENCDGHIVESQYDILQRRTAVISNLGANLNFEFDQSDNNIRISSKQTPDINGADNNSIVSITYDQLGMEIDRLLPGGIRSSTERDNFGRIKKHAVSQIHGFLANQHLFRQYKWDFNNQLKEIIDNNSGVTRFDHDTRGNLSKISYNDQPELRNPDKTGNLFETSSRNDRKYGKGGKLIENRNSSFTYDVEGNLIQKKTKVNQLYHYEWNGAGMLTKVIRPDKTIVTFKYDALGRRIEKRFKNTTTKWFWDVNKPLHEWKEFNAKESTVDDIITWVFEANSYTVAAKVRGTKFYSIIKDHAGTPIQAYSEKGELIWERELDSYGRVRMINGESGFCNHLFQGQEFDNDIGLAYNRYRYYDPENGIYISQDKIGLNGSFRPYGYVSDPNILVDLFGLTPTPYEVGTYNDLKSGDETGDGLGNHHVPQKSPAKSIVPGYPQDTMSGDAPAIRLPDDEHADVTRAQSQRNTSGMTPQQLAQSDINMLRDHTNAPESQIKKLIRMIKEKYGITCK